MKTLLVILFITAWTPSLAQDVSTDTLTWVTDHFRLTGSAQEITRSSRFVSTPQKISWYQRNDSFVYEFTVTGTTGSWSDTSTTGEITFQVSFRNGSGTIRFARFQDMVSIQNNILIDSNEVLPYTFHVTTVSDDQP